LESGKRRRLSKWIYDTMPVNSLADHVAVETRKRIAGSAN
jgi:hypothetical protein